MIFEVFSFKGWSLISFFGNAQRIKKFFIQTNFSLGRKNKIFKNNFDFKIFIIIKQSIFLTK
jgi:hypothetical protein